MSSDPLSFFAAEDSSSSESDSGDEENAAAQDKEVGEESLSAPGSPKGVDKLPSPDTLFATVGRPAFLDNPLDGHINWDRFVKTPDSPPEPNVHSSGHYVAIPPPKEERMSLHMRLMQRGGCLTLASLPENEVSLSMQVMNIIIYGLKSVAAKAATAAMVPTPLHGSTSHS